MMVVTNLSFIQQEMIRYGVTIYLVMGVIGNVCNCIMFGPYSNRRSSSSIYFLPVSIFANLFLIWSAAPLIRTLNHLDLQQESLFYCKVRPYGSHVLVQSFRYSLVFACADRYLITQDDIRFRSFNSVSVAIKLIVIMLIGWILIGVHIPILVTIRNNSCGTFDSYKLIYTIYQIPLAGIFPPLLMSIFAVRIIRILHQRHVGRIRAEQRDRSLTRLLMAEVLVNIFAGIPVSIYLVYGAATYSVVDKSVQRLEIESFMLFITQFLIQLASAVPFYIFLLTSKQFRKDFNSMLVIYWYKYIRRRVRVAALN
jgi:hypothetical protein